jgi:predicted RNA binding protein YcfA (HicA-like mRNA interferase family)
MKVADVDVLCFNGWYWVRNQAEYRQLKHPERPGRVTVAGKAGERLAPGALESILKQAGFVKRGPPCATRS